MNVRKGVAVDKRAGLLEFLLCLSGKAGDYVRAEHYAGERAAQQVDGALRAAAS